MLTKIGLALDEDMKLIHTERRLSDRLKSNRMDDEKLRAKYLEHIKPLLTQKGHRIPTIAVDKTDISKPWARKMPWLGAPHHNRVRDASLPYEPKTKSGERCEPITCPGWDLLNVDAVGDDGRRLPLYSRLYCHSDPDCKKEHGETRRAILGLKSVVPKEAIWTFDRAYYGLNYFRMFNAHKLRWVCRVPVNKGIAVYANERRLLVADLLPRVEMRTKFRVRKYKHKPKKKHKRTGKTLWDIKAGWITNVRLPNDTAFRGQGPLATKFSIVVTTNPMGRDPMVLITNTRVASARAAREIANSFHERWGVEEAHRFMKQAFDLEDIRILNWTGLKRMVLFVMLAHGYLGMFVHKWRAAAYAVAAAVKAVNAVPVFMHYRLQAGIAGVLKSIFVRGP